MNEQYVRDNFTRTYDSSVDGIFEYCYSKTAHRDVAKYLTRSIFMEAWDNVVAYGQNVGRMKSLIKRITREQVADFISFRRSQSAFSDNLWNLTLSQ